MWSTAGRLSSAIEMSRQSIEEKRQARSMRKSRRPRELEEVEKYVKCCVSGSVSDWHVCVRVGS